MTMLAGRISIVWCDTCQREQFLERRACTMCKTEKPNGPEKPRGTHWQTEQVKRAKRMKEVK